MIEWLIHSFYRYVNKSFMQFFWTTHILDDCCQTPNNNSTGADIGLSAPVELLSVQSGG